jgi:hypothetical protein
LKDISGGDPLYKLQAELRFIAAFVLFLFQGGAAAADNWLCTQEASQRKGSVILSCGIGSGADENAARLSAFDAAKAEFAKICSVSDDCKNHLISAQPRRTACEQNEPNVYRCYRLIEFDIGQTAKTENDWTSSVSTKPDAKPTMGTIVSDHPDNFQPFSYEQIANLPKVRRGMSKKKLLEAFGVPRSVSNYDSAEGPPIQQMAFTGSMCLYQDSLCFVTVRAGKVESWDNFKPIYTEDLKSKSERTRHLTRKNTNTVGASLYKPAPTSQPVYVISPEGELGTIDSSEVQEATQNGWTLATPKGLDQHTGVHR